MTRRPSPWAEAQKRPATCAKEHQLIPIALQAHFKDLSYLIVFIWDWQDDKVTIATSKWHIALFIKLVNLVYYIETNCNLETLRDPTVIMGTSVCRLWPASAMSRKMTSRLKGEAATPLCILSERKVKYLKLLLVRSVQLGSGCKYSLFTELH